MRYQCEILNHGIHGYKVWLHGRNQGRSGVNLINQRNVSHINISKYYDIGARLISRVANSHAYGVILTQFTKLLTRILTQFEKKSKIIYFFISTKNISFQKNNVNNCVFFYTMNNGIAYILFLENVWEMS